MQFNFMLNCPLFNGQSHLIHTTVTHNQSFVNNKATTHATQENPRRFNKHFVIFYTPRFPLEKFETFRFCCMVFFWYCIINHYYHFIPSSKEEEKYKEDDFKFIVGEIEESSEDEDEDFKYECWK